jgi:hypothetical protein
LVQLEVRISKGLRAASCYNGVTQMVLSMARPQKHPRTSFYLARKVVPRDLREAVGKRELVRSLGTKDPDEAKRLFRAVMARFDAILAAARAETGAKITALSPRDVAEIAGEVDRAAVRQAEDAPGTVAGREHAQDALLARLEGEHGVGVRDPREFNPKPEDIAEARAMLAERGIATDAATLRGLAVSVFGARVVFWSKADELVRAGVPIPGAHPSAMVVQRRGSAPLRGPLQKPRFNQDGNRGRELRGRRRRDAWPDATRPHAEQRCERFEHTHMVEAAGEILALQALGNLHDRACMLCGGG